MSPWAMIAAALAGALLLWAGQWSARRSSASILAASESALKSAVAVQKMSLKMAESASREANLGTLVNDLSIRLARVETATSQSLAILRTEGLRERPARIFSPTAVELPRSPQPRIDWGTTRQDFEPGPAAPVAPPASAAP